MTLTSQKRKRVLLVAMPDSVHVARWLEANNDNNLDILIFASSPMRRVHPLIRRMLEAGTLQGQNSGMRVSKSRISFALAIPLWVLDRKHLFDGRLRGLLIAAVIGSFNPDLVHTMESQNGGYSTIRGLNSFPEHERPKSLLTLFGSDIFWFSRFEYHQERLRQLLTLTDALQAECARDAELAYQLGFRGHFLPLVPVSAGMPSSEIVSEDSLDAIITRKSIAIKGYAGTWGQAKVALDALRTISNLLYGFTIELYSCDKQVERYARRLFRASGVHIVSHPKFALTHTQVLALFRRSRLAIALSKSDGLPASMLEAMSQGAFPVQSKSACIDGWINDGINGSVITDMSPDSVAYRVFQVINDELLLRTAADANIKIIKSMYSDKTIRESAGRIYEIVIGNRNL